MLIGGFQTEPRFALYKMLNPDWPWDLDTQLLAHMGDLLAGANWQRSGDKHARKPEPIKRPGLRDDKDSKTFGRGEMTLTEVDAWLSGEGMTITPSQASTV